MHLRFAANLNFLFCENGANVLDKFSLARAAGFRGIELGYPEHHSKEEVIAGIQENQLNVALLNIALGKINCITNTHNRMKNDLKTTNRIISRLKTRGSIWLYGYPRLRK